MTFVYASLSQYLHKLSLVSEIHANDCSGVKVTQERRITIQVNFHWNFSPLIKERVSKTC